MASTTWTKVDGTTVLGSAGYAYVASSTGDHRGSLASITDSVLGAVTASYDGMGRLVSQKLASGLTQSFATDPTGDTVATTWSDVSGNVFLGDAQVSDVHGRWRTESLSGADPGWTGRSYGYDAAGRLTSVAEQTDSLDCLSRTYAFDVNSNRTSSASYPADASGGCATVAGTQTSSLSLSYDNADRMLPSGSAAGAVYDAWGRITSLPAGLTSTPGSGAATASYYANDLVASLTQGGETRSWTLDPAGRLASMSTTGLGSTALVNHYGDASGDSPAWTADTASTGTVTTRRYITGFAGLLAEAATTGTTTTTTVELTGLHGDVLRTTTPGAAASPDGAGVYTDEYGQVLDPDTGSVTTGPRYGWLGGKQRAVDTGTTGLTLMGVRLYAPAIGRFLTTDPIYGGNANTYTSPVDPIGSVDLDGLAICKGCFAGPSPGGSFARTNSFARWSTNTVRRFAGETEATSLGRLAHNAFNTYLRRIGLREGNRTIAGTRLRPDGFNARGAPIELKPFSGRSSISRGLRQLHKYERAMDREGEGELWVYTVDGKGNFHFWRYR